jgi:hypothetical protein
MPRCSRRRKEEVLVLMAAADRILAMTDETVAVCPTFGIDTGGDDHVER